MININQNKMDNIKFKVIYEKISSKDYDVSMVEMDDYKIPSVYLLSSAPHIIFAILRYASQKYQILAIFQFFGIALSEK